ncbi:MAG: glycoside hydrolase family 16 protein [Myxococcales bacterium]|nr:glycoside hydrolase family 16 protein [Myxococcales bacterium]
MLELHRHPWATMTSIAAFAVVAGCVSAPPGEATDATTGAASGDDAGVGGVETDADATSAGPSTASGEPTASAGTASTAADVTGDPSGSDGSDGSAPGEGWTLVWSDEFDGDAIDPTRWQHEVNCWGGGNGEQQCYTASPENAFVEGGMLHLVARSGPSSGPAVNDDDPNYDPNDTSVTLPYSSARLRTRGMGDWTYGRVEVRARMPQGQGTWTGVWMLPTDGVYGTWAASGEIDIVETVNLHVDGEDRLYGSLHYGSYWPANVHTGAEYRIPGANPADDFHDYAMEWEQGEIRWYVDDHHYATQRADGWYTLYDDGTGQMIEGQGAAPFDQSFHLLLNLAVGGAWAGNVNAGGIDASVFPQEMTIDHVRVYQCAADPATGLGCATLGDDAVLVPGIDPPP